MNWDWANLDIFKTYSDNKENPKKKKKDTTTQKSRTPKIYVV